MFDFRDPREDNVSRLLSDLSTNYMDKCFKSLIVAFFSFFVCFCFENPAKTILGTVFSILWNNLIPLSYKHHVQLVTLTLIQWALRGHILFCVSFAFLGIVNYSFIKYIYNTNCYSRASYVCPFVVFFAEQYRTLNVELYHQFKRLAITGQIWQPMNTQCINVFKAHHFTSKAK